MSQHVSPEKNSPTEHNSADTKMTADKATAGAVTTPSSAARKVSPKLQPSTGGKVNIPYLNAEVLGTWAEERLLSRELMSDPAMHRIDGLSMQDHRERSLAQLQLLVQNNAIARAYPKYLGGQDNHGGNLAQFQELVLGDPSTQIKAGVQWGLFGAAILHLGTKKHHDKYLPNIISLKDPGIYAMTEVGHGSDVDSLATTATYDKETDEFVLNTPFRAAWKTFLGNAALHGKNAVVFAQLITDNVNHGVHALYVPIRNEQGELLPGVQSADNGLKGGLNGIDNGQLAFDHVRVPRENLLNRYGDVDENGVYTSPIASPGRRFFTMLGTLVQGRVSLDGAASIAGQVASYIGIIYGSQRRQFAGVDGKEEMVILDYQRHQRRLVPRLAQVYAMTFAQDYMLNKFDEVFSGANDTDESRQDLETIAAALKPVSTWNALDMLQETREATGGQGFMAENRLVGLRQDLDIYVTFEGDNNVLLQLVGKRLLTDYATRIGANPAGVIGEQVARSLVNSSGLRLLGQKVAGIAGSKAREGKVSDATYVADLLQQRIDTGIAKIAAHLNRASKQGKKAAFEAFNENQNELIRIAYTYAELLQLNIFSQRVKNMTDGPTQEVLGNVRDLFALTIFEKYSGWFMMNGLLSSGRAKAIGRQINQKLSVLRPHLLDLVSSFGLTDELVRAEIATGVEQERQNEARAYFERLNATGDRPVHEKELRRK